MGKALTHDRLADGGTTPSRKWAATHGGWIAGRAAIDAADAMAAEMERRWGVGRLRLLVATDLREKFDRQRYLFNQAVWHGGEVEDVRRESQRMVNAWAALDKAARGTGAVPMAPEMMEVGLSDGRVCAIVPDAASAHLVMAEDRSMVVYTLEEIARLIDAFPLVSKAKDVSPGATVVAARQTIDDPLAAIDDTAVALDDPLPF